MERTSWSRSFFLVLPLFMCVAACSQHDSGEPVEFPTPPPTVETPPPPAAGTSADLPALAGTAWTAQFIEGKGELSNSKSTLEFLPEGRAAGGAGCNRYGGPVEIAGDSISFGALMSTKMACTDAGMMEQEQKFLEALAAARVYRMEEGKLVLVDETGTVRVRLATNTNPQS